MNHSLSELIKQLGKLQQNNGAFQSFSTATPESVDSIYFTSLILLSLATIPKKDYPPEITSIVDRALHFLLTNSSISTTWNYLPRNTFSPYPDDVDDTFLALSAIEHWKKDYLTPERFAHITNTLIRCEVAPGGPYKTWITEANSNPPWNDVDYVVNTTIHRWLCAHNIDLHPLQTFLNTQNASQNTSSLYYHNKFFVGYLIDTPEKLSVTEKEEMGELSNNGHPIEKIISAIQCIRTNIRIDTVSNNQSHKHDTHLSHYYEELITRALSHKVPFDFYIEKIESTKYHYAYCTAMEIALCIELLVTTSAVANKKCSAQYLLVTESATTNQLYSRALEHLSQVRETVSSIFSDSENIRDFFVKQLDLLIKKSPNELLLPYYYYESLHSHLQKRITPAELVTISSAHAVGVITFTLQDEICDRHISPEQIPYVTSGSIAMESLFQRALFQIASHESLRVILYRMNTALIRETRQDNNTPLSRGELGNKSIGLVCGILAIITIVGGNYSAEDSEKIVHIFSKYLSARQLLDDCHDWPDDHAAGRTTWVTQEINTDPRPAYFWNHVFPKAYHETIADLKTCKEIISSLRMTRDTSFLAQIIDTIEATFTKTYSERNHVLQFICTYKKTTRESKPQ